MAIMLASPGSIVAEPAILPDNQSDTWLEVKLDTTIALNRHLSLYDIDTDVRNQTAYLTGIVDTIAEKELAEEIAKSIEGMKSVDNEIVVDRTKVLASKEKRSRESRSFGAIVDDLTTTASVKSKILMSDSVSVFDVDVTTRDGLVTLGGKTKSETEKDLAEKLARNVSGVTDVVNNIKVQS